MVRRAGQGGPGALRLRGRVYVAYGIAFVLYGAVLRDLPGFGWFHIAYLQAGIGL